MRLFFSILLFYPMLSMAQIFSTGDEFIVDDNRVGEQNTGDSGMLTGGSNTNSNTSGSSNTTGDGVTSNEQNLEPTGGFNVTQQGGLEGTNQAYDDGSGVQAMGMMMGAAFMSQCNPQNPMPCVLGAMSFVDALTGKSSKNAAKKMEGYLDPRGGGGGSGNGTGGDVESQQAEDALVQLAEMGYTVNPDGSVSTPMGETFTSDDFADAESLMKKGIDPAMASQTMNSLANTQAAAAENAGIDPNPEGGAVAAAGGGGSDGGGITGAAGGGSRAMGPNVIEEVEYRGSALNKKKKGDRLPAGQAAKLSKNFNGDPIGISLANLFLIVHKKYRDKKKNNNEFINGEF